MISSITHNATFSLGSESGHMRLDSQDGQMRDPSGRVHALANHSVSPEKRTDLMTNDTSGQTGIDSLGNADLALLLASRFQARTLSSGSTLYNLTWKKRTTPAQGLIYALRGSVHRTSDNDCIGWLAPGSINLAGWGTPTARDYKDGKISKTQIKGRLGRQVWLVMTSRLTDSGEMLTGSNAVMKNGGRLNPEHSRWLMGIPPEWSLVAPKNK